MESFAKGFLIVAVRRQDRSAERFRDEKPFISPAQGWWSLVHGKGYCLPAAKLSGITVVFSWTHDAHIGLTGTGIGSI